MRYTFLLLCALLLSNNNLFSQGWLQQYHLGYGSATLETNSGHYLIAGVNLMNQQTNKMPSLSKVDAAGNLIWERIYPFSGSYYGRFLDIKATNDNHYILTGSRYRPSATGESIMFAAKIDTAGNLRWMHFYNNSSNTLQDNSFGYKVMKTYDGGFAFLGRQETNSLQTDIYVVKTDSAGTIQWSDIYGTPNPDISFHFHQTPDSGFVLTSFSYNITTLARQTDLIKIDKNGTEIWHNAIVLPPNGTISASCQTQDGGYLLSGGTDVGTYLLRTNAQGDSLWTRTYAQYNRGGQIHELPDRSFVFINETGTAQNV